MTASAWIMTILIAAVLYGGLAWCIRIAVRKSREEKGS